MAFIRASVFMLAGLALLLAHTKVHANREFPHIQGMKFERNSMARQEYQQAKQEEIHAKMFKSALAQYQLHTHRVPDENVKSQIAKALRAHSMAHPLAEGNMKMHAIPLRNRPLSNAAALPNSATEGATPNKMACGMDMVRPTDGTDSLLAGDVNNESTGKITDDNTQTDVDSGAGPTDNCINPSGPENSKVFAQINLPGNVDLTFCLWLPKNEAGEDTQQPDLGDYDYP